MKKLISFLVCVCMYAGTHAQTKLDEALKRFNSKLLYGMYSSDYPTVLKVAFEPDGTRSITLDPSYNKDTKSDYKDLEQYTTQFSTQYRKIDDYLYAGDNSGFVSVMYIDGGFYFGKNGGLIPFFVSPELAKTRSGSDEFEQAKALFYKVYEPKLFTMGNEKMGEIKPNSIKNRKITGFFVKLSKNEGEKAFAVVDDKENEFLSVNAKNEEGTIPLSEFIVKEISTSEQTAKSGKRVYAAYPLGHPQLIQKYTFDVPTEKFPADFRAKVTNGKNAPKREYDGRSVQTLMDNSGKSANGLDGFVGDNAGNAVDKNIEISVFTNPTDKKQCLLVNIASSDFFLVPLDRPFTIDVSGGNGGNGGDGLKGLEEGTYTKQNGKIKTKGSDKSGNAGNGGNGGNGANVTLTYDPSVEPYLKNITINVNGGKGGKAGIAPTTFAGVEAGKAGLNGANGVKGTITKSKASIKTEQMVINLSTFTSSLEETKTGTSLISEKKKYIGIDASTLGGATTNNQIGTSSGALKSNIIGDFEMLDYCGVAEDIGNDNIFLGTNKDFYYVYNAKTKKADKFSSSYNGSVNSIFKSPSGKYTVVQNGLHFFMNNPQNPTAEEKKNVSNVLNKGQIFEFATKNTTNADAVSFENNNYKYGDDNKSIYLNFLKKEQGVYKPEEGKGMFIGRDNTIFNSGKYAVTLLQAKHWKNNYFVVMVHLQKTSAATDAIGIYVIKADKNANNRAEVVSGIEITDVAVSTSREYDYEARNRFGGFTFNPTSGIASVSVSKSANYKLVSSIGYTLKLSTTTTPIIENPKENTNLTTIIGNSFQPYKDGFIYPSYDKGGRIKVNTTDANGKIKNSILAITDVKFENESATYQVTTPNAAGKAFLVIGVTVGVEIKTTIVELSGL